MADSYSTASVPHEPLLRCSTCHMDKPSSAFTPRPSRPRGFCSTCKPCNARISREYQQAKREEAKTLGLIKRKPGRKSGTRNNLTGRTFGLLTVVSTEWRETDTWVCTQCACGQTWEGKAICLTRSHAPKRSCGCTRGEAFRIDYTGQTFGRLTVLSMDWSQGSAIAHCQCLCGEQWSGAAAALSTGNTTSCGCKRRETNRHDLTGQVFGRLTVVDMVWKEQGTRGKTGFASCVCLCGNPCETRADGLLSGRTKSCGCLAKEIQEAQKLSPEHARYKSALTQHRRRSKKKQFPCTFTQQDWNYALEYWGYSCAVCHKEDNGLWHFLAKDHFIPVASATYPGEVPWNILPLCHARKRIQGIDGCNNMKGKKDPLLWLTEKLGPRRAKAKLREIEVYFALVRERSASCATAS